MAMGLARRLAELLKTVCMKMKRPKRQESTAFTAALPDTTDQWLYLLALDQLSLRCGPAANVTRVSQACLGILLKLP